MFTQLIGVLFALHMGIVANASECRILLNVSPVAEQAIEIVIGETLKVIALDSPLLPKWLATKNPDEFNRLVKLVTGATEVQLEMDGWREAESIRRHLAEQMVENLNPQIIAQEPDEPAETIAAFLAVIHKHPELKEIFTARLIERLPEILDKAVKVHSLYKRFQVVREKFDERTQDGEFKPKIFGSLFKTNEQLLPIAGYYLAGTAAAVGAASLTSYETAAPAAYAAVITPIIGFIGHRTKHWHDERKIFRDYFDLPYQMQQVITQDPHVKTRSALSI